VDSFVIFFSKLIEVKMKIKLLYIAVSLAVTALNANAADSFVSSSDERVRIDMTIYNNNMALLKDVRNSIEGKDGYFADKTDIIFDGISDQIIPETLGFSGGDLSEFNYSYDLTSHDSLLKNMIGYKIDVLEYGSTASFTGTLLSDNGNRLLIKREKDGDIVSLPKNSDSWTYFFNEIPPNLTSSPTLEVKAFNLSDEDIGISYLTNGLSWTANYVATIESPEEMDLNGWVTINNTTSTSYEEASVNVVAGSPNINSRPDMYRAMQKNMRNEMMVQSAMPMPEQGNVGEYKIYKLPFKTDIEAKQKKQVALFDIDKIDYKKTYEHVVGNARYGNTEPFKEKVKVYVEIKNNEVSGLGMPIPSGNIRFYEKDSFGDVQFIGENKMPDLNVGETERFNIGEAFDISIKEMIGFEKKVNGTVLERNYLVDITNSKADPVEVNIIMPLESNMIIVDSNEAFGKLAGRGLVFPVRVEPDSTSRLEYTMKLTR